MLAPPLRALNPIATLYTISGTPVTLYVLKRPGGHTEIYWQIHNNS